MPRTKQPASEPPATSKNLAKDTVELNADALAKVDVAKTLLEKKAAAARNRYRPPTPRAHHIKGKKIGNPPRGTRKSMGKR